VPVCVSCESVAGQPVTAEPHHRQELLSRRAIHGALRLDYVCRFCGTQMFRLQGADLFEEVWTVTVRPRP
jgi:hypothetical protein